MGKSVYMVVVTPEPIDLTAVGLDAAWAFGPDAFPVDLRPGGDCSFAEEVNGVGRRVLEDADPCDLPTGTAGHAYEVQVSGRFYGVGYECGRFAMIDAIASWFESRLADAVVYYGSDNGAYPLAPWREQRDELRARWLQVGMRPYYDPEFDD